jgi:hypothetical protein
LAETGCEACSGGSAEEALVKARGLERTAALVEESHFSVRLCVCPSCGQKLVSLFSEQIDWQGGDDPQLFVVMSIAEAEAEMLRGLDEDGLERAVAALADGRRFLITDFTSTRWSNGPLFLPRHD